MADHADEGNGRDVFVYRGVRAPQHVTHVRIDESVEVIEESAFRRCKHLVQVETHDGIRRVGSDAFLICKLLRRINLQHVVEIGEWAFNGCTNLESVEGDKLETIVKGAFAQCTSLKRINLSTIVTINSLAFFSCTRLTDIEFSERLETIEACAFQECKRLQRISIPLKRNLFVYDDEYEQYRQFDECEQLRKVELVGGIHTIVSSLHMESWRNEMEEEINQINQVLPTTHADDKTDEIMQWMESVLDKMDRYRAEHYRYVKEAASLLELALWKVKLGEKEETCAEGRAKKSKIDAESARREKRITCGADMVIKNVLPFLRLE